MTQPNIIYTTKLSTMIEGEKLNFLWYKQPKSIKFNELNIKETVSLTEERNEHM